MSTLEMLKLNQRGEATVKLPTWFEALNADFRYQLTPIGSSAPNLFVSHEIQDGQFGIAGGAPATKVSWQVSAVRHDVYAEAHRIQVEEDKPIAEQGSLLNPELYERQSGPVLKSVRWSAVEPSLRKPAKRSKNT